MKLVKCLTVIKILQQSEKATFNNIQGYKNNIEHDGVPATSLKNAHTAVTHFQFLPNYASHI